jgi:hypothetical protein
VRCPLCLGLRGYGDTDGSFGKDRVLDGEGFLFLQGGAGVGEGGGGEIGAEALTDGLKEVVLGAGHGVVAAGHADDAAVDLVAAIDDFDDVEESDFVGGAGESETAARAFGGGEDAALDELAEDFGEEFAGEVSLFGEFIEHDKTSAAGGILGGILAHDDQFGEGTNGIFGRVGKDHGESP